jgi:hypothetical protein
MDSYFNFLELDKIDIKELLPLNKAVGINNKSLNHFLVNRDHPIRKLIRKPLQISFLRNTVLNSNVVEKIKNRNKKEMEYTPMTIDEKAFCDKYFKEDLIKLKENFGIEFG